MKYWCISFEVRYRLFPARQEDSRRGHRWQQSWRTCQRQMSLLRLLPVNGVIQLLHLLIVEDTVSKVGLELLQGQLSIICTRGGRQIQENYTLLRFKGFMTFIKSLPNAQGNRTRWLCQSLSSYLPYSHTKLIQVMSSEALLQIKNA